MVLKVSELLKLMFLVIFLLWKALRTVFLNNTIMEFVLIFLDLQLFKSASPCIVINSGADIYAGLAGFDIKPSLTMVMVVFINSVQTKNKQENWDTALPQSQKPWPLMCGILSGFMWTKKCFFFKKNHVNTWFNYKFKLPITFFKPFTLLTSISHLTTYCSTFKSKKEENCTRLSALYSQFCTPLLSGVKSELGLCSGHSSPSTPSNKKVFIEVALCTGYFVLLKQVWES